MVKPQDLALRLLSELRRSTVRDGNIPEGIDATDNVASLILQVARIHQSHEPWESIVHMQRVMSSALEEDQSSRLFLSFESTLLPAPYDTFTVLIAWLVIFSCILYIALKDSFFANHHWRHRRSSNHGASDSLLTRLPDLDDAWTTMLQWYKEQPSVMRSDSVTLTNSPEPRGQHGTPNHGGVHNHHQNQSQLRRRRKR